MENIDFKEYFISLLKKSEIKVKNEKIEKMMEFLELLYKKNQVMNLTAIRDKKGMLEKHFIDSLFLTKVINDTEKSFIDVGTGAGFPGLVLAIYYPEKNFLLVDSVRKKIDFINEVIKELNLKNVNTSFERSEELIKNNREIYDIALCRGVANLRIILEYMIPFIKVNGRFLPQKLNLNEIEESKKALKILNAKIKALLRRSYSFSGIEKLEFAGYVLSENTLISTQEVEHEEVELTSSENKILTLLFRGNGEVVTKEKILQELWQTDEFIDANTLNVKMTRLRKKLGEIGFDKHIMTKRGSGYALV